MLLRYIDFKNIIEDKNLKWQFKLEENSGDKYYYLFSYDGGILYECNIDSNYYENETLDFENNYKNTANKNLNPTDDLGNPLISTTLGYVNDMQKAMQMYKFEVVAGIENVFDIKVETERVLLGGEYWIQNSTVGNVHEGDIVEFGVVDKEDVLGYFSMFGLSVVNGDILKFPKFVIDNYVLKGNPADGYYCDLSKIVKSKGVVKAGLYLRTTYKSFGTTDLVLLNNYTFYRG